MQTLPREDVSTRPRLSTLPFGSRLRLPELEELLTWEYDQVQRYVLVSTLLDRMTAQKALPVRVLDVGANVLNLWPRLFPGDAVQFTRCDVERFSNDPDFVVIPKDGPLPFDDLSFDVVVGIEVLEHLPGDKRGAFLEDCLRVAHHGAIWTCPNGSPDVAEAEREANAAYEARQGSPHPFLQEHADFDLPRSEEIVADLQKLDYPWAVFDNAPLEHWLSMLVLGETLAECQASGLVRKWMNQAIPNISTSPAYRRVYVVAKSFEASDVFEPLPEGAPGRLVLDSSNVETMGDNVEPARKPLHALNVLAEVTRDALRIAETEHRAALQEVAEIEGRLEAEYREEIEERELGIAKLEDVLANEQRELRSLRQQLLFTRSQNHGVLNSWGWKLLAPLRALRDAIVPRRCERSQLVAWNQVEGLADLPYHYRSTGGDPQLIAACHLPKGWVRLRYRLITDTPGRFEIYADHGDGFHPTTRIEACWIARDASRESYVYFDRPVCGIRIDPLDNEGEFHLAGFEAHTVSLPIAFVKAFFGKLWLLHKYSCTLPALGRGLKLLMTGKVRTFVNNIFKGLTGELTTIERDYNLNEAYDAYRQRHRLTDAKREQMRDAIEAMVDPVRISIVMPAYNSEETYLREAIDSVLAQLYPHWELCIANDGSSKPRVRELLDEYAALDSRIRVTHRTEQGGIAAASNSALEMASGAYIALLDHDDFLAEQTLFRVAEAIHADRGVDMLYTDEDKVELDGRHVDPFFKPIWSPEFFQTCMYTCHLGVYRTELVRKLGGFRSEYDCAQDYDLALRIVARTKRIRHIPEILYHFRKAPTSTATGKLVKPRAHEAAQAALTSHLKDLGVEGRVEKTSRMGLFRTRFAIQGNPPVSIVIPSACQEAVLHDRRTTWIEMCLESIRRLTTYSNYEIVVTYNESLPPGLEERLQPFGVRLVPFHGKFNLATKMNLGVAHAKGEHVVLLNDDIEVISPDWLESMLEYSQQRDIGAVGVKLLFPNDRIQHVGVCLFDGSPGHYYYGHPGEDIGYFGVNALAHNCGAVTGACVMTKRALYEAVGGFDEAFHLNYNDVDFCLKLRRNLGKRIVYTPHAMLYHYESVSKEGVHLDELRLFQQRWQGDWANDPYYNPNFSRMHSDYRINISGKRDESCKS